MSPLRVALVPVIAVLELTATVGVAPNVTWGNRQITKKLRSVRQYRSDVLMILFIYMYRN
jgi:hypothetical protein